MTILNTWEWFDHYFYKTENLCNAYLFSSTDPDYFEIEPFTGNFKMIVAAESEEGINSDIIDSRVGDFIATTDYQDPQWVEYDLDTLTRWTLNGSSYANMPVAKMQNGSSVEVEMYAPQSSVAATSFMFDSDSATVRTYLFFNTNGTVSFISSLTSIMLDGVALLSGDNYPTDGLLHVWTINAVNTCSIDTWGARHDGTGALGGVSFKRISGSGINTDNYPSSTFEYVMSGGYSVSHSVIDNDNGVTLTKVGDVEADYVAESITTVVDDTFNGVIAWYEKDGVRTNIDNNYVSTGVTFSGEIITFSGEQINYT